MNNLVGGSHSRRHNLSDWLALHELDTASCRRILEAMARESGSEPAAADKVNSGYQAPHPDAAWLRTVEAMREFLPEQRCIIDDTFENITRVVVNRPDGPRKALTLDNGATEYPTVLVSYRGLPADFLTVAHEFGHALQIRASRGKFVPPIMREVCAFLGEGALLSHTLHRNCTQHPFLAQVWQADNLRYFGRHRERLQQALTRPDTPYNYSWNYPIARYLTIRMSERCSLDRIWRVFEGAASVTAVWRETTFAPD